MLSFADMLEDVMQHFKSSMFLKPMNRNAPCPTMAQIDVDSRVKLNHLFVPNDILTLILSFLEPLPHLVRIRQVNTLFFTTVLTLLLELKAVNLSSCRSAHPDTFVAFLYFLHCQLKMHGKTLELDNLIIHVSMMDHWNEMIKRKIIEKTHRLTIDDAGSYSLTPTHEQMANSLSELVLYNSKRSSYFFIGGHRGEQHYKLITIGDCRSVSTDKLMSYDLGTMTFDEMSLILSRYGLLGRVKLSQLPDKPFPGIACLRRNPRLYPILQSNLRRWMLGFLSDLKISLDSSSLGETNFKRFYDRWFYSASIVNSRKNLLFMARLITRTDIYHLVCADAKLLDDSVASKRNYGLHGNTLSWFATLHRAMRNNKELTDNLLKTS